MVIQVALTEADLLRCFPVMRQLRPHLTRESFLQQVAAAQQQGYQLAFLTGAD